MPANLRIGTASNLETNGSYDLLLVRLDSFPAGQVTYAFYDTPRKATGIQKVAQTFVKILLTRKGSDALYPNRGTNFFSYVAGSNRTAANNELIDDIRKSLNDAESQTKSALNSSGQDYASMLQNIVIQAVSVDQEAINIYVKIITKAGETAQVAIPFPELDLSLSE